MKNKYIIALFVLASIVVVLGALLKILHFEIGPLTPNILLAIGVLSQVLMALVFIIKILFSSYEKNDFLNK